MALQVMAPVMILWVCLTDVVTGNGTANDTLGVNINDSFYKTCNMPIEYDSTTGAITEIRSNNIGVLLLSRNGVCTFGSKFRVRFSDG